MTDISTGTLSAELEKSLQNAPTTHPELLAWVRDVAALTCIDQFLGESVVFLFGTINPVDTVGLGECCNIAHPG